MDLTLANNGGGLLTLQYFDGRLWRTAIGYSRVTLQASTGSTSHLNLFREQAITQYVRLYLAGDEAGPGGIAEACLITAEPGPAYGMLTPVSATATGCAEPFAGKLLIDGNTRTGWKAAKPGEATEFVCGQAIRLAAIDLYRPSGGGPFS